MPEKLKDVFFSTSFLERLSETLRQVYPDFDPAKFTRLVYDDSWAARELKEKMHHVARCLHATLPDHYPAALRILSQVAPSFSGFDALVFCDYVEQYGLEHWELSLPALALFTQQGSAEFAIRPFLARDPERAMAYMRTWAEDSNPHIRRLASEGCRPRLPWGMALPAFKKDPSLILPVLEKLKADESEFVRKSVANNLNDISKDHPDLVLAICERWYGQTPNTDWVVKHACRGLLKAGNRRALALFGFGDSSPVRVDHLTLDRQVLSIGEELGFTFELNVAEAGRVRLEYKVYYQKSTGRVSPKVFQIREDTFAAGSYLISRKHSFEERSTRKHHPGPHQIEIIVNGIAMAKATFEIA